MGILDNIGSTEAIEIGGEAFDLVKSIGDAIDDDGDGGKSITRAEWVDIGSETLDLVEIVFKAAPLGRVWNVVVTSGVGLLRSVLDAVSAGGD